MMRRAEKRRWALLVPVLALLAWLGSEETELLGYVLLGPSWGSSSVPYYVNPDFVDASAGTLVDQMTALQTAANEWNVNGGANVQFVFMGQTSSDAVAPDGVNTLHYKDEDGNGPLAVCTWWDTGGTMTDFDIRFYDRAGSYDFVWALSPSVLQFDIQGTATHELGHALGLDHSNVLGSTMYAQMTPGSIQSRTLEVDDMAGLQALYGPAPVPGPTVTGVTPARGWVGGGDLVTVHGSGFVPQGTTVTFDGLPAGSVNVLDGTTLTCVTPAGSGQRRVDVAVSNGTATGTGSQAWTWDTLRTPAGDLVSAGWNALEMLVPEDASQPYHAVFSTGAGNTPMIFVDPTDPRLFPLLWSPVLHWSLYDDLYQLPYWNGLGGTLDAAGHATYHLYGLVAPELSGFQLHTCFFVVDPTAPSSISTISNRVTLTFP